MVGKGSCEVGASRSDTPWGAHHLPRRSLPLVKANLLVLGSRRNADRGPRGPGHAVHRELCASPPGRGVTVTEGSGWAQHGRAEGAGKLW